MLRRTPIRVCLRGTADYMVPPERADPPFRPEELAQLARGDIPYFFHIYGQSGVFAFDSPDRARVVRLRQTRANPALQVARHLRSPSRASLAAQGLFAVIAAFDHKGLTGGVFQDEGFELRCTRRQLIAGPRDGGAETRRDLSAFVGSVYLPCACGEDRAVFAAPPRVCVAG